MNQTTDPAWEASSQLPTSVLEILQRPDGREIAVIATVDPDGMPRTAAFGSVRAISPRRIRFACNRSNHTFANLSRDGRVMIALYAPSDVAVGIRGRARIIKENLDSFPTNALVQVEVEGVKNELLPSLSVVTAMTYGVTEEIALVLAKAMAELLETP